MNRGNVINCDQNRNGTKVRNIDPERMKVLFVKPYWPWGSTLEASPPMGFLYLSAALKETFPGITVRLLDLRLEKRKSESLENLVRTFDPDLVGFMSLTGDYLVLERLTAVVKRTSPRAHVSCGGPYPTHCPEDFRDLVHVDSMVRGEGENSVCDLVSYLAGRLPEEGLAARGVGLRKQDGSLPVPGLSPLGPDLDRFPFPDWSLIDIDRYSNLIQINAVLSGKRYMPMVTSRGCPFHCTYCHSMFGKKVRLRSPENVVDEIETLVRHHNVDEIQIYDDIFNIDRERMMKICDLIVRRGLNIRLSFPNAIRSDMLDDEMILKLKEAGAYMITFAIETASPKLQKLIRKNLDLAKAVRAIDFASRIGLITRGFFMIGFPTETEDEIKNTLRLACRLPLTTLSIFSVVPFKGTELHDLAQKATSPRGRLRLANPDPSYFAPNTFYTDETGISLRRHILLAYFRFFTPVRLVRYFLKIPRKALYLRLLGGLLKTGFIIQKNERP